MECREKIVSNDFIDILVDFPLDFSQYDLPNIDYCFIQLDETIGILYIDRKVTAPLSISEYRYVYIPKCYGLTADSLESQIAGKIKQAQEGIQVPLTGAYEASGIVQVQGTPLELTGRGILVGFIDTGIRYQLDAFKNADGSSKIVSIWDQTDQSGTPPADLIYGTEYTREMLNEDLTNRASGVTDGLLDIQDESGHGTKVASVAINAAPNAEIVMVKCRQAKPYLKDYYAIPQTASAYAESDIMAGLKYLEDVSIREGKPIVICITMGTNMGDHASHSLLDQMLQRIGSKKRRCIVIAGGNEGNAAHHYEGNILLQSPAPYEDVEIRVGEKASGFIFELWGNIPSIYTISIRSPDGEMIQRIPALYGRSQKFSFVYSNSVVTVDYVLVELNSGAELVFVKLQNPLPGIWTIRVYAEGDYGTANYNIWLPIRAFLDAPTYFLSPNPYTTLTEPAYCENAISLSYYDSSNNSFAIDSGRGYQRLGLVTPDLSAAGINVQTVLGTDSGSSISAGLMAGAAAQFMQWAIVEEKDPLINSRGIRNYFIRGAQRDKDIEYPNQTWGYGRMNIAGVFSALVQ